MREEIFVDTGAWFALFVAEDVHHSSARQYLDGCSGDLITTDYVVDETLTLLRTRVGPRRSARGGEQLFKSGFCRVEKVTTSDFLTAWRIFSEFIDKEWSFTDCVSRVIIDRLAITTAFAFDEHFRQFGTVKVVP